MASFRQRGNRWQALVRRQGHPDEVRSFITRQDAERWSRSVETDMDRVRSQALQKLRSTHWLIYSTLHRFKAMARSPVGKANMALSAVMRSIHLAG